MKKNNSSGLCLRQLAEEMVLRTTDTELEDAANETPKPVRQALYELRVHQIELEMQNEELRRVQVELEESKARYLDFYNLAPVGYCTISTSGMLQEVSLTFSRLLGAVSRKLIRTPFSRHILSDDADIYYLFQKKLLATGESQKCELRLVRPDKTTFWAQLTTSRVAGADGSPECSLVVSDISERKQAEQHLQESEERYELLAEQNRVYHWEVDVCGLYTYISDVCTTVTGLQPHEIINKKYFYDLHPEQGRAEFKKATLEMFARQEKFVNLENCVQTATGQSIWVSTTGIPIVDDRGKLTGYRGTDTDINERKQVEEKYAALFSNSVDAIFVADPASRQLVDCNKAAELLTGYSKTELLSMNADKLHPYDRVAETMTGFQKQTDGENVLVESEVLTKANSRIPVEITSSAITTESGRYLFGVFKNISARIKAETELRASQERFRSLFIEAPLGIAVVDTVTGKYLETNPAFSAITGRDMEELTQVDWISITHPDDIQNNLDFTQRMLAGELTGFRMEKRYLCKHGTAIWINMTVAKLHVKANERPRHLCMIEDITERKLNEERIAFLSYHDVLTGLYNRRFLEEQLQRLDTVDKLPVSIISGDVNNLKITNDVFGYAKGDELIKTAAQHMTGSCRVDDIVVRYGGDEFVAFLPRCDEATAQNIIEQIQLSYRDTAVADIPVSLALGCATMSELEQDIYSVVNLADSRMCKNKIHEENKVRMETLEKLEQTAYATDSTEEHAKRMRALSLGFGEHLQLSDAEVYDLALLATLHDIGKVAVPETIVNKQGALTAAEWEVMETHTLLGNRILRATRMVNFNVQEGVLAHHENWDGSGYPNGLTGKTIPLISRIIKIIDAYDAMTSDRTYRKAMSHELAIEELQRCAGTQFDPELVAQFVEFIGADG